MTTIRKIIIEPTPAQAQPFNYGESAAFCDSLRQPAADFAKRWGIKETIAYNAFLEAGQIREAHAQRLADALKAVVYTWEHGFKGMETGYDGTPLEADYHQAREALAQWEKDKQ